MADVKRLQRPLSPKDLRRNAEQAERDLLRMTSAGNNNSATIRGKVVLDNGDIDITNLGAITARGQAWDDPTVEVTASIANRMRYNENLGQNVTVPGVFIDRDGFAPTGDSPRISSDNGNDVTASSRISPPATDRSFTGPSVVQKSRFRADGKGSSLHSSAWDSSISANDTSIAGRKANSEIAVTPGFIASVVNDDVGSNNYLSYARANIPDTVNDGYSDAYLLHAWQFDTDAPISILITPARRFSVNMDGVDLNSPTNITGLLTAQAITATDVTASGTVQGVTVKATGQVQGASAVFTGNVQVGTINGAAYPPPSGGQTLLSPLSPSNWTALGDVFSEVFSTANRVGLSITMRYTGSSTALSTTSYTNIGTVLPSAVRSGSVTSPYLTSGVLGGGISAPVVLYVFVNISTGDLQIRPASAVTIANGSLFTISYLYKLP